MWFGAHKSMIECIGLPFYELSIKFCIIIVIGNLLEIEPEETQVAIFK